MPMIPAHTFRLQHLGTSLPERTMPSRNNPNVPSKLKRKANRSKVQKRNAGKVTKAKNPRGTAPSSVLHPSSGPAAPLSGKKARKVEKALNHARRRALEAAIAKEGEVIMTGESLGYGLDMVAMLNSRLQMHRSRPSRRIWRLKTKARRWKWMMLVEEWRKGASFDACWWNTHGWIRTLRAKNAGWANTEYQACGAVCSVASHRPVGLKFDNLIFNRKSISDHVAEKRWTVIERVRRYRLQGISKDLSIPTRGLSEWCTSGKIYHVFSCMGIKYAPIEISVIEVHWEHRRMWKSNTIIIHDVVEQHSQWASQLSEFICFLVQFTISLTALCQWYFSTKYIYTFHSWTAELPHYFELLSHVFDSCTHT